MQLKLILRRDNGTRAQLAVTADATAVVADLAAAISASDPERGSKRPADLTLKLEQTAFDNGASARVLDPSRSVIESGLRSGSTVSLAASRTAVDARARRGRAVVVLRVLTGPDAGREFSLPAGNAIIGTGPGSDVRLTDPAVAAVHAALTIGESIEVGNLAGPSGVMVGGRAVQRAFVGATDELTLANTSIAVLPIVRAGSAQSDSVAIEFNRSPRVITRFAERVFTAPAAPQRPEPAPLPLISMFLPLLLGLGLFAVTRSLLAVVFIALSPVLMVGAYVDTRLQSNKKHAEAVRRFSAALDTLTAELGNAQRVERAVRLSEAPALSEVAEAIHRLGPLLWTHRPEQSGFLTLRLGLGDALSRCRIELQAGLGGEPEQVKQLTELRDEFHEIRDVPVVADLRDCGALGICGPRGLVDGVARGLVMQLVGLHSPAELAIAAFSSPQARQSWEWLEWLPHAGSVYSPLTGNHLTESTNGGIALLSRLEELVKQRRSVLAPGADTPLGALPDRPDAASDQVEAACMLPAVVVLVEDTAPIERARLIRLAERGPRVGVHVIWVAIEVTALPAACRSYVLVDNATDGSTVGEVRRGKHHFPVACESLDSSTAKQIALLLAPVVDIGAAVEDETDLPRSVSLLSLTGPGPATDAAVIGRQWIANHSVTSRNGSQRTPADSPATLRALVGSTGADEFYLDLREQGPHALVGGTTGSGKSEFLQSWVLGMAAAHSPDRVTFLLVDYKGGAAFADCVALPHTVGLVTDLSPHLVRRALTSLRAELRRREHLLNLKHAKDLQALEQAGDADAPPCLVIVVDEFAALATEVPEFVDGVIDVAARGRSLGLHLILATQRPAGVIRDNLRANTNLRIALRVNDVDDSLDVIEDPLAAHFPLEIPGRAAAKTGPGRLTVFQSAYVGGWSGDTQDRTAIDIYEFAFGRRRPWNAGVSPGRAASTAGPTDIARIVTTINTAAQSLSIPAPRKPWLPPLSDTYALETLVAQARDGELVIGRGDRPDIQGQPIGVFDPDHDGNMAILGTGGSGKSTALRTLAISAAMAPGDGPVHVYGFDFASGSLAMLEPLPHVAAIVDGDDDERIGRVLRRITAVLEERSRTFARVHAASISDYRRMADPTTPRILLLVDGVSAFREAYEHVSQSSHFAMFSQLAADGRMLGINVVLTADRPNALSTSLASTIQRRLILRLASDDDYVLAGVPTDILSSASPPGRGIMDSQEIQTAVLGGDANVAVQARVIDRLAAVMRDKGFQPPQPVGRLSEHVRLDDLPAMTPDGLPTIGITDETLSAIGVRPQGVLMVSGPPHSGRSTTLLTLAQAARRRNPTVTLFYITPSGSALANLGLWNRTAVGTDPAIELANELIATVESGRGGENLMLVIESLADFGNTEAENELVWAVKSLAEASAFVVGESEVSTWGQAWLLGQPFKSSRRGLILAPSGVETDTLLSTPISAVRRREFPPGRGVLIDKGREVWMQVAQPAI